MTERGQTPLTNILTDTADREVKDNDAAEREHLRAELTYTKAVLAQTRAELARVLRREDFLAHSNNVHLTKALSAQVVELNNQLQARDKLLEQLEANAEDVAAEKAQQVGVLEKINDKLREQTEQLKLLQAENYVLERKLRITENELNSAKAALQIEKHLKDLPASPPPPPKNEPQ